MSERDMEYIRQNYNVPAKKGGKIIFKSKPGIIMGAKGPHLKIQLCGETDICTYHPTWEIEYVSE